MATTLLIESIQTKAKEIEIVYQSPLGHVVSRWKTESFDNFVRMYSNLKMNRLHIISINFLITNEEDLPNG